MKALTFHGKRDIRVEQIADPSIQEGGDVIVKVKSCAICGSDLHVYHEHEQGLDKGTVMGHEFIGEIVETGPRVKSLRSGDRVMAPFTSSCGTCFYCRIGLTCRCEKGQLFGWVEKGIGLHGGQGEFVRVPLAEQTLVRIPEGISGDLALLLGDILSTGYFCADQAQIHPDQTQVVVGCGPVGLMTIWAAQKLGATRLFAIDSVPERLQKAQEWGAIPINLLQTDPLDFIRSQTQGRGADAVMEVVGNRGAGRLAFDLLRPGGVLSTVGVCNDAQLSFSPPEAYGKNLTYKVGRCPARHYMERLIPLAREDEAQLSGIFTHRMSLDQGPEGYRIFANREEGCMKVVLDLEGF